MVRLEDHPTDAIDGAAGDRERIDPVAEFEGQAAARLGLPRAELERLDAPERESALDLARKASAEDGDRAESAARRLAFSLAQSWMGGLLAEAGVEIRPRGNGLLRR